MKRSLKLTNFSRLTFMSYLLLASELILLSSSKFMLVSRATKGRPYISAEGRPYATNLAGDQSRAPTCDTENLFSLALKNDSPVKLHIKTFFCVIAKVII
jgi:hypothetical protein